MLSIGFATALLSLALAVDASAAAVPAATAERPAGAVFFVALPASVVAGKDGDVEVPALVIADLEAKVVVTAAVDGRAASRVATVAKKDFRAAKWAHGADVSIALPLGDGDHDVRLCFSQRGRKTRVCGRLAVSAAAAGRTASFLAASDGKLADVATASVTLAQDDAAFTVGQGADPAVASPIHLDASASASVKAQLGIIANGMEILGIAWGGPTMIMGYMHMSAGTQDAMKKVLFGAAGVTGGLATPGVINWLVASARDANLFS